MTLETERRLVGTGQTLQGAVKQRHVRGSQVGGQRFFVDRKTVVLAGDGHATRVEVFDRVIGTMVTKLHLESFGAAGQGHDLVTQANTKRRNASFDQLFGGCNGVVARLWVARAVGQEDAIGLVLKHVGGRRFGGYHCDLATALGQHAQDVFLDAKVVSHHVKTRGSLLAVAAAQLPLGLGPIVRI